MLTGFSYSFYKGSMNINALFWNSDLLWQMIATETNTLKGYEWKSIHNVTNERIW
jgi:hypothetical protein